MHLPVAYENFMNLTRHNAGLALPLGLQSSLNTSQDLTSCEPPKSLYTSVYTLAILANKAPFPSVGPGSVPNANYSQNHDYPRRTTSPHDTPRI
jgi:hypothetical protein